jgi:plastocyanin
MKLSHLMLLAPPLVVALTLGSCGTSSNNNNNDAGPGACTDMTGNANPTVGIATTGTGSYGGYAFTPVCVQINRGQSVTFTGNYSLHNLQRTTQTVATAANPLPATPYSDGSTPKVFGPFPDSGDFNFYCPIHGFAGTVRVNP